MSEPIFAVRHIDLSALGEEPVSDGRAVLSIFWWKDLPLGMRASLADELPLGPAQLAHLTAQFASEQRAARDPALGAPLRATFEGAPKRVLTLAAAVRVGDFLLWLDQLSIGSVGSADELGVIVCTRDRGELLADCLAAVAAQRSPAGETIVVDNSVGGNARPVCDRFSAVRYVHEPRPGLSAARNAGLRASTRPLIAFTDDDAEPHSGWTAEIMRAFAESDVDALTGLVLPSRLDTAAQRFFQFDMGGFLGSKFVPTLFERRFFEETSPACAQVWRIGAGANMAFRRTAFERAGVFDERLGAGASGCSEDSEFWYRLLAMGGACLYEPRAVVFHNHREDWPGLKRQMRAYMRGHVSALVVQYGNFRHRGNLDRIFRQLPRYFVKTAARAARARPERRSILIEEILGWATGLGYLVRFSWQKQRPEGFLLPPPGGCGAA